LTQAREIWRGKMSVWLARELRVLLTYNGYVPEDELEEEIEIVDHIVGSLLEKYGDLTYSVAAKEELSDFLFGNTDQFLFELMLFLRSNWSMEQFDNKVMYTEDGKIPEVNIQKEELILNAPCDKILEELSGSLLSEEDCFFDEFGSSNGIVKKKKKRR